MKEDFYNKLSDDEKQICDLCRDWNLEYCERCEFVSRYSSNETDKEVKL